MVESLLQMGQFLIRFLRNQEASLTQLLSVFANQKSHCPLQISEIIYKN
jgi:hypothetical protein